MLAPTLGRPNTRRFTEQKYIVIAKFILLPYADKISITTESKAGVMVGAVLPGRLLRFVDDYLFADGQRGQTTLDFAIAMGIFLVALTFVFAFVPGMLQPFEESGPEETTLSNRVAKQLAGEALVDPGEAPVLDISCTLEFFRTSPTGSPECAFDQSVSVPDRSDSVFVDRIGVKDRQRLNVTLEGDYDGDGTQNTLCWDDDQVVEVPGSSCDVTFAIGTHSPPSQTGTVVVARRVVSLAGQDATLEVRAW